LKILDFPLLADENLHPDVVAFLRSEQSDVRYVREAGLIGSNDLSLIRLAHAEGRVIVTHDRDFGALAVLGLEPLVVFSTCDPAISTRASRSRRSAPLPGMSFHPRSSSSRIEPARTSERGFASCSMVDAPSAIVHREKTAMPATAGKLAAAG